MMTKSIKDDLLEIVSEADIVRFYLPEWSGNKGNIRSPFASDSHPSFSVFFGDKGLRWKCHSTGKTGDAFQLVSDLKGVQGLAEVIKTIKADLGLTPSQGSTPRILAHSHTPQVQQAQQKAKDLSFVVCEWTEPALEFWGRFGVSKDVLERFGVRQISSRAWVIEGEGKPRQFNYLGGRYAFGWMVNGRPKVYQPAQPAKGEIPAMEKAVYRKQTAQDLFGFDQLPIGGNSVILAEGEKDALVIASMGFPVIALPSASAIPPAQALQDLEKRFGVLAMLFDADEAGKAGMARLGEKFPQLQSLHLPDNGTKYDFADFAEKSYGEAKAWLSKAIGDAIKAKQEKERASDRLERFERNAQSYIRCGNDYYRIQLRPSVHGEAQEIYTRWNKQNIVDDHGKEVLPHIKRFEGFICIPDHFEYKREVSGFFNMYKPLRHHPAQGDFSTCLAFVKHIFGHAQDWEMGLDYLQVLYTMPREFLPVLCLVSKARNTGKSTFAKWLNHIFGSNLTWCTNQDLDSQFNEDWAGKLMICLEEASLNKKEITERIKAMSTSHTLKVNAKGRDKVEVDNFAKWLICSNNEEDFIVTDSEEVRFWVLKVPVIESNGGQGEFDFFERLQEETPAFLHWLKSRKMKYPKESRSWFRFDLLPTEALKRLQLFNEPRMVKELREMLRVRFIDFGEAVLKFSREDLQRELRASSGLNCSAHDLRRLLLDRMGIKMTPSQRFEFIERDQFSGEVRRNNRHGCAYEFMVEDWLSSEELEGIKSPESQAHHASISFGKF